MRYIFLDTNNWIYLSNGHNILSRKFDEVHFKIFDVIDRYVKSNQLTVLTNKLVFDEWQRNKAATGDQIKKLTNDLKDYQLKLKTIGSLVSKEGNERAQVLTEEITKSIESKIQRHKIHIQEVERFLTERTVKVDITRDAKALTAELAAAKKAPFHAGKNNWADAFIVLSSIEYIRKAFEGRSVYPLNYFVSSNKEDFSHPDDPRQIHPDLKPYFDETDTEFYYTLAELVNSIEADVLSEAEAEFIESHFSNCPACNFEYAYTLEYSDPYKVFDPNKGERNLEDPNQTVFSFAERNLKDKEDVTVFESEITEAGCSNCATNFFVCCNCNELNEIDGYNQTLACEYACGYFYRINADMDKKGFVHGWDIEIVAGKTCQGCGDKFLELSDSDLCAECEELYGTGR